MKKKLCLFVCLLLMLVVSTASAASKINSDGYYKGIRLAGKVKVVDAFPDIKIQYVNSFPGLP